jgi:hypothetical protein
VRADLAEYLEATGSTEHPLASGLLALADRLDKGNDPLTGLAAALRQLEQTLGTIIGTTERAPDAVDVIRLRHLVSRIDRAKGDELRRILDGSMIEAVRDYSRRTRPSVPRTPLTSTVVETDPDEVQS